MQRDDYSIVIRRRLARELVLIPLVVLLVAGSVPARATRPSDLAGIGTDTRIAEQSTTYLPLVMKNYRYFSPEQMRFGVNEARNVISSYRANGLNAAWYVTSPELDPPLTAGMQPVFVIHLKGIDPGLITQHIAPYVARNPGRLWLVGNEPDRDTYQDDLVPSEYVVYYHNLYHFIKEQDPTAQIAIGAVVQPTPLRLYYLDMILDEYQARYGQAMPVDVWNIHNMILNEHPTEWGAGIPPGVPADVAEALRVSRSVYDNDDINIFKQQLVSFREWMAARGQRSKPLIITEFGVLMPYEWYPEFDRESVRAFMYAAFDFLLSAADGATGYPADSNRLVQRWAWYSLDDAFDPDTVQGFNGNLFDPETLGITGHGLDYGAYTVSLR